MDDAPNEETGTLERQDYPCQNCGALLAYKPGADALGCDYCGHVNPLHHDAREIIENDLDSALRDLEHNHATDHVASIKCDRCAAELTLATVAKST